MTNRDNVAREFDLYVGSSAATTKNIAAQVTLAPGGVYTEAGLVAVFGDDIGFRCVAATTGLSLNVFGEEVDNF